jgi:CHAT domain-containing protein
MLLMDEFYRLHALHGMDFPAALRAAQMWLKRAKSDVLAQRLLELRELKGCPATMQVARRMFRELAPTPASDPPPFGHPYYWAAFTYSGPAQHTS